MAIDYHDLTALADVLKYVYGDGVEKQFAEERSLWNLLPTSEDVIGGSGYQFSVQYARAQGTGARDESKMLPPPLVGKYDKGLIVPKYVYGRLRMTGPSIERAKSNVMSFVNSLTHSVDDIYQSVIIDLNRMCWGDGFGLIATLSADSDTVTTTASGSTWTVTCDNDQGVERCIEGMLVDFYESTAIDQSTVASRISSVNYADKSVEMEPNLDNYSDYHPIGSGYTIGTPAVAYASGGYMVAMGARDASFATSDTPIEMTGFEGCFDDGTLIATFEDIVVATYPRWAANILGNSSVNRELSIDLMLEACDAVRARSNGRAAKMYMGLGQRRKYAGLLMPDIRFEAGKLKGGYESLTFAGGDGSVEIIVCPEAPVNKIFVEPDKGGVEKFVLTDLGWGDLDQQMHWRSGYDEWDQFLRIYGNLGVKKRQNLCLIKDLTEPSKSY